MVVGAFALMGAVVRSIFSIAPARPAEGRSTKIIEGGRIRQDGLAKELLTESELLTVAAGKRILEHRRDRGREWSRRRILQQPAELRRRTLL